MSLKYTELPAQPISNPIPVQNMYVYEWTIIEVYTYVSGSLM